MLDFTLPSMPSRVPPRAAAPAAVDRPSADVDAVDAGDESFATTLDALAEGIDDQAEASDDAPAEEDSVTSSIVPTTAPPPEAIQPVVVPGWMVALRGDGAQGDAGPIDGAATPDAGNGQTGAAAGSDTPGINLTQAGSIPPAGSTSQAGSIPPAGSEQSTELPGTASEAASSELAEALLPSADGADTTEVAAEATAAGAAPRPAIDTRAALAAQADSSPELTAEEGKARQADRVATASLAAFLQESATVAAAREGALSFEFSGHSGESPVLTAHVKTSGAAFATALANTPTFDALPSETTAQLIQAIRLQWARGGGEAHIKLEPHHFGDLKVSIKVDQGQVTARLEADVPVVREWLQSNQALLRTSLAEQNLTLDRLEVAEPRESRDPDERQQQQQEGRPKPQSSRRRRSEARDVFEVVA